MALPEGTIKIEKLVTSDQTSRWCLLPYPNHPKGCPNYGKKKTCPPAVEKLIEVLDLDRPIYAVHSEFNLSAHVARMRLKHPDWTDRQLKCVLYWQGTSRKQLRERISTAIEATGCNYITTCPEAQGLNVFATCQVNGLKLDRTKTLEVCRHVAIIGYKKEE